MRAAGIPGQRYCPILLRRMSDWRKDLRNGLSCPRLNTASSNSGLRGTSRRNHNTRLDKAEGRNPTFVLLLIPSAPFVASRRCFYLIFDAAHRKGQSLDCVAEAAYPTYTNLQICWPALSSFESKPLSGMGAIKNPVCWNKRGIKNVGQKARSYGVGRFFKPLPFDWGYTSTRSRSSLPALKCGTHFSGTLTRSPDFGFRPVRGGR